MASHRLVPRGLALVAAAAIAAMPLVTGLAGVPHVRAAEIAYPAFGSGFGWPLRNVANAGVVDLTRPPASGEPELPNPATVTEQAGPGALQASSILRADLSGSPLAATTLVSLHLEALPVEVALSTIPISRATAPHTWQELLAGSPLKGIPLQSVTWKQVASLVNASRPAALDDVTMSEVDWSASLLADLPLAAFTFGGADVTSIDIPLQPGEPASHDTPAKRWCYLLNSIQAGSCSSPASLAGQTLIGLSVQGAPLKNIPLKNIPLKNIDLSSSPLKNIPLKNIVLDVSPLKNIPLKNIALADSPLKNIPLKNIMLDAAGDPTASPLKNIPLKNIAWATSPLKNIPLKNIDLSVSPLKNIPLKNIDFGVAPLKNIPLKNIDLSVSPLKNIPLKNIAFATAPLKNIPLKNIDIAGSPLKNIPLKNIALAGAPLKNIPLKNIDFGTAPLKNIPLKNIDLGASAIGSLPLSAILWTSAPLGARPASHFVTTGAPFATPPAPGATLASVAAAGGFTAGATLANLLAVQVPGSPDVLLGDVRLDLAGAAAPAVTLEALLAALGAAQPDPVLGDLGTGTLAGAPTLGDLRLDVTATDAGTAALTVGDLLALLAAAQPDVLLGDLRLDLVASAPAITLADFIVSLQAAGATPEPDVLLGDLRLDAATGVDSLVIDAITAFLLDPVTFAPYLLGALNTWTDITGHDITLGELGLWTSDTGADITLGELAQYLDGSVSLADVLLGLVPPSAFPYEDFPIASLGLSQPGRLIITPGLGSDGAGDPPATLAARPAISGLIRVDSTGAIGSGGQPLTTEPVRITAFLPPGSTPGQIGLSDGVASSIAVTTTSTDPDGRVRVSFGFPPMASGKLGGVSMQWQPGLALGPAAVSFEMETLGGTPLASTSVDIVPIEDGAEPNSPGEPNFHDNRIPQLPGNPGNDPRLDSLVTGYISRTDDIDWYRVVAVPAGSRITADLTNLPLDADLVLYGPSGVTVSPSLFPTAADGLPGRLVEDAGLGVGRAATSLAAQALADLRLDDGWTSAFVPPPDGIFAPMTPLSISQHRGSDAESVGTIAPVTGDYMIEISGYNGATSINPYLLRARVTNPKPDGVCPPRTFPNAAGVPGIAPVIPAAANAVFLTDPSRLAATHGQAAADAIALNLSDLVAYLGAHPALGISPVVIPLDAYATVDRAYDLWDTTPCSVPAANGVAREITGILSDIRATSPNLAYVTIVGGDDIVPMGRVADLTRISNESDYASTFGDTLNPISAAEAGAYTLTDDPYGDPNPVAIGDGSSLFVPRIAVGRLVETPGEISAQLASFGANGGALDTHTGLVAGYDFLADGASAAASRLTVGGRTVDGSLIDSYNAPTPWDGARLLAKLFPATGASPLVASVNAHYDHTALLPSAGNVAGGSAAVVTASDIAALSTANELAGRVLFTMGCHAGLAVPDAYVTGTGGTAAELRLDWAQTLSKAGVSVYVANTGFGIGDTATIAYSERLMALYAKLLDGSLTAGQALVFAKQAYYGSLAAVGVYDLKILQQTAFYGLPFWGIGTVPSGGRIAGSGTASPAAAPVVPALPGPLGTDAATGLVSLDHTVNPVFTEGPANPRGRFWTADGQDPQVTQYLPIQPRTSVAIGTAGQTAHGALVTSLASHDVANVNPVLSTPTIDLAASAPEVEAADAAWPARMAVVRSSLTPDGPAQDLVLVPGAFLGSPSDGTGVQRLFDSVGVRVLYAPSGTADFAEPVIARSSAPVTGASVAFAVVVADPNGDGADGTVKRVLAAWQDTDGTTWRFTELANGGAGTWTGTGALASALSASGSVRYFVQAVDAAGNVAVASGKGEGFEARVADTTDPAITAAITPAPGAAGWIAADSATVTFTCTDGGSGIEAGACPAPVTVSTGGLTEVSGTVTDRAGNEAGVVATVRLDGVAPTITANVVPAGWSNGASATVTFTCSDGLSGLDAAGCPAPVTVSGEGAQVVSGTVHDVAGNAATATVTARLDRTAPSITAAVAPAPNAAGWNRGASVGVTFTCGDTPSGLAGGACPAPVNVTAEGVTTVSGSVDDRAANRSTSSATIRLDRTAPAVTFSGAKATLACVTTDALSGVATAATISRVTAPVNGIPMTTATCSGATDVAGNATAAVSAPAYVAPISFTGFFAPVDNPPVINSGSGGRTYPVKFQLKSEAGAFIPVLPAVASTTYQTVNCATLTGTADPLPTTTTGNSGLSYDAASNQFQYNWKTPSGKGCHILRITLADGQVRTANFSLK